jgi:O-antigen/teichoic acid export membrane protein
MRQYDPENLIRPRFMGRLPHLASYKYYGGIAKRGMIWSLTQEGVNLLLTLPTLIILARLLSPKEFGIAAAASFFIQLANRLTKFGFNTALLRMKTIRPEHASTVFVVSIAMGVLSWIVLSAAAPWVGEFFRSPETTQVLPVAALTFVISSFGTVPAALMSRAFIIGPRTIIDWLGTVTYTVSTVTLAWLGFSFWSLVYGELLRTTITVVAVSYCAGWPMSIRFSRAAIDDMLSFGMGIYAKRVLEYAALNADSLVVGRILGVASLGLYDKAFGSMTKVVGWLTLAGPSIAFRIFVLVQADSERFRAAYRKLLLSVTLVGYPCLTWFILVAPSLFLVGFGERWVPASYAFQILCVTGMMKLLNAYASVAMQAKDLIWTEVSRQLGYLVLLIVGVAIGARWGVTGAAGGVLIATVAMSVVMHELLRRTGALTWSDVLVPQLPAVTGSAGVSVTVLLVGWLFAPLSPSPWQFLLIKGAAAAAFYVAYLLKGPFPEMQALVWETVEDLGPKFPWLGRVRRNSTEKSGARATLAS